MEDWQHDRYDGSPLEGLLYAIAISTIGLAIVCLGWYACTDKPEATPAPETQEETTNG